MTPQNWGFLVFVAVQALNLGGLVLDFYLFTHGHTTITQYVWKHPFWGLPILTLQADAFVGLAVHFYPP